MNCFSDAGVGATTAEIARQCIVNVGITRIPVDGEQRCSAHHLSRLAIAALWNVDLDTGMLYWVIDVFRQAFDGSYFLARHGGNGSNTRTRGFAADVNGTGAAERHATTELGTGHVEGIAQDPQQWHRGIDVDGLGFSVKGEANGHKSLPRAGVAESHASANGFLRKVVLDEPLGAAAEILESAVSSRTLGTKRTCSVPANRPDSW